MKNEAFQKAAVIYDRIKEIEKMIDVLSAAADSKSITVETRQKDNIAKATTTMIPEGLIFEACRHMARPLRERLKVLNEEFKKI